jgi:transcriptional regulator
MYVPAINAQYDPEVLYAFMTAHPFAILVTASAEGVVATHLPLVLDRTTGAHGTLEGHLARANPQSRQMSTGMEALVIFPGPNAYISPTWYPSKAEHGKVVPTWNYIAIHAYGELRIRDDPGFLRAHLDRLSAQHESSRRQPWAPSDAPPAFIEQQQRAIVAFQLVLSRLEGKWKMSQNRSDRDIDGVVTGLAMSPEPADRAVSEIVDAVRPRRGNPGSMP